MPLPMPGVPLGTPASSGCINPVCTTPIRMQNPFKRALGYQVLPPSGVEPPGEIGVIVSSGRKVREG